MSAYVLCLLGEFLGSRLKNIYIGYAINILSSRLTVYASYINSNNQPTQKYTISGKYTTDTILLNM